LQPKIVACGFIELIRWWFWCS